MITSFLDGWQSMIVWHCMAANLVLQWLLTTFDICPLLSRYHILYDPPTPSVILIVTIKPSNCNTIITHYNNNYFCVNIPQEKPRPLIEPARYVMLSLFATNECLQVNLYFNPIDISDPQRMTSAFCPLLSSYDSHVFMYTYPYIPTPKSAPPPTLHMMILTNPINVIYYQHCSKLYEIFRQKSPIHRAGQVNRPTRMTTSTIWVSYTQQK